MPNEDWMQNLNGDLYLPQLSIPGTHDTGCYQYTYWPMVRTQTLDVPQQFAAGVRAFDVRCGLTDGGRYHIFHGSFDQEILVRDVIRDIAAFLAAHQTEVVLLLLKGEYGDINSDHLNTIVNNNLGNALYPRPVNAQGWPRLRDCRGRALVLSRLQVVDASHYSLVGWPDNCLNAEVLAAPGPPNYGVRIQDLWKRPRLNDKRQAITDHLTRANRAAMQGNRTFLYFNYSSASWIGYEPLNTARNDLNPYLVRQFGGAGVIFMDAVTEALASHIIGWNPRVHRARPPALDDNPAPRPARRARRPSA